MARDNHMVGFGISGSTDSSARMPEMVGTGDGGVVFETLGIAECHAPLASGSVGRVAGSIDALSVIVPVIYAADNGAIVLRTTPGTKSSAALLETVVAFEVDDYEPNGDVGWSVLAQGVATRVTADDRIDRARQLLLRLIAVDGESDRFVRVEIAKVSGRRLRPRSNRSTQRS